MIRENNRGVALLNVALGEHLCRCVRTFAYLCRMAVQFGFEHNASLFRFGDGVNYRTPPHDVIQLLYYKTERFSRHLPKKVKNFFLLSQKRNSVGVVFVRTPTDCDDSVTLPSVLRGMR
jgi:hypothetical protein